MPASINYSPTLSHTTNKTFDLKHVDSITRSHPPGFHNLEFRKNLANDRVTGKSVVTVVTWAQTKTSTRLQSALAYTLSHSASIPSCLIKIESYLYLPFDSFDSIRIENFLKVGLREQEETPCLLLTKTCNPSELPIPISVLLDSRTSRKCQVDLIRFVQQIESRLLFSRLSVTC